MPTREEIVTFRDVPVPPGASPWVDGAEPTGGVQLAGADPAWPRWYDEISAQVRAALGLRVLQLEHVGSTSVPGLPAKPVVDVDLVVADPDEEAAYVPPLEALGFVLRVREPWWYRHRMLRGAQPACNLHVFGPESPEPYRHRVFRDWLRADDDDRALYASTKAAALAAAHAAGETVMQYNARKEAVLRDIHARAFAASGLLPPVSGQRR